MKAVEVLAIAVKHEKVRWRGTAKKHISYLAGAMIHGTDRINGNDDETFIFSESNCQAGLTLVQI